jgi:hypothetical protein
MICVVCGKPAKDRKWKLCGKHSAEFHKASVSLRAKRVPALFVEWARTRRLEVQRDNELEASAGSDV